MTCRPRAAAGRKKNRRGAPQGGDTAILLETGGGAWQAKAQVKVGLRRVSALVNQKLKTPLFNQPGQYLSNEIIPTLLEIVILIKARRRRRQ